MHANKKRHWRWLVVLGCLAAICAAVRAAVESERPGILTRETLIVLAVLAGVGGLVGVACWLPGAIGRYRDDLREVLNPGEMFFDED